MPLPFIAQLILGVGMLVGGYLLMPKPKQPKPPSLEDFENPTVDAGRPVPKLFGSKTIRDPNVLWYGDKSIRERTMETDKK